MISMLAAAMLMAPSAAVDRALFDSFKAACLRTGNLAAVKADALASGWTEMAEGAEPRIARLVRMGRDAAESGGKADGATFRRVLDGRDVFLIVSRYEDKTGFWGVGCRVYDFSATAPLAAAGLEAWMGKPPTGVETPAPGLVRRLWEPAGWRDGITVEISHVPQDHPLGQQFGLSGNILTAQAIGGF